MCVLSVIEGKGAKLPYCKRAAFSGVISSSLPHPPGNRRNTASTWLTTAKQDSQHRIRHLIIYLIIPHARKIENLL